MLVKNTKTDDVFTVSNDSDISCIILMNYFGDKTQIEIDIYDFLAKYVEVDEVELRKYKIKYLTK